MLNIKLMPINQYINTISSATDRKKIISITLGLFAGRKAHLPSDDVESINTYYEDNIKASIYELIYGFNEQLVIDTLLSIEVAQGFYKVRYNQVHPDFNNVIILNNSYDVFCNLSRADTYISKENYEFANLHKAHIFRLLPLLAEFDKAE